MTDKNILSIQKRDSKAKKVKQLRQEGLVPANVFGGGEDSLGISLNKKDLVRMLTRVGDTPLFYLKTENNKELPVLVDELQAHPLNGEPVHVSFKRVNLLEKVSSEIPVELVGENAVSGAVVVLAQDNIEVEALPADLPEKFEIDISKLTEIGQAIGYSDLSYDKNKVELLVEEEKLSEPIVLLQEVKEEVVIEEPSEDEEGTEVAAEEGAEAKEGESSEEKPAQDSEKVDADKN